MDAKRFDIVVIGGGPAGCYAAKTAADMGATTIILEEHGSIGLPRHCTGWIIGGELTEDIKKRIDSHVILQAVREWKIYDPHARNLIDQISVSGWGGYLVCRDAFDREIAKLAVNAGCELQLGAKVLDFKNEKGKKVHVVNTSTYSPVIDANLVICADGLRSIKNGFASKKILGKTTRQNDYTSGILLELAGVKDITPGVVEVFDRTIWPHADSSCFISFPSMNAFKRRQRQGDMLSKKIENARTLQVLGYESRHNDYGKFLDKMVKEGVIFVGDATGSQGIIHGMISGYYAGKVAAESIQSGDIGLESLLMYERILKRSDVFKSPFLYAAAIFQEYYSSHRRFLEQMRNIVL